jgi:hypothetical protein
MLFIVEKSNEKVSFSSSQAKPFRDYVAKLSLFSFAYFFNTSTNKEDSKIPSARFQEFHSLLSRRSWGEEL